ncbi:hypothetical protein BJV78DRAFT_796321 [Lactifluus subvellereus]|nr:hypothetical protein BJV78DRAFT_796321 [Lactifluus subvellereus]
MKPPSLLKKAIIRAPIPANRRLARRGTLSPTVSPNANNPIIALPVEILHAIFAFCAGDPDLNPGFGRHKYPPSWVAITYVCRHWRAVALDFKKLWSSITPDLSPEWIAAFLQRSSYAPTHVNIDVGPPLKKPSKKHRLGIRRRPVKKPSTTLHGEVVEEIFSHASRVEILHLEGNTMDVIRALTSLCGSIPLVSLSLGTWDGCAYLPIEFGSEDQRVDTSLILPENFLGGSAPRLRHLRCRSSLHVTSHRGCLEPFPSSPCRARSALSIYSPPSVRCLNLRY